MSQKKIVLLCTGLGRVQRGFEMYISSLAQKLGDSNELSGSVEVWCGGDLSLTGIRTRRITNVYRKGFLGRRLGAAAFLWEQRSFFLGMLPRLLANRRCVFYMGEYQLYCYLFKFRKLFGLNYSLLLYTGGQAIPGLFDPKFDFVHHVTDMYLKECGHIPADRQLVLPHFIQGDFEYDTVRQQDILQKAAGKKIVLSVGLIDNTIKRMDFLVQSLAPLAKNIFPVLLGEPTSDTPSIEATLERSFGKDGYILKKMSHRELGDWYDTADLFVLCSPKESFGLAMVEALNHGLPVICDDFAEARFVLQGKALFTAMKETSALTEAVSAVIQVNQNSDCRQQRKEFVQRRYSWEALEAQYLAMFRKMAQA